MQWEHEPIERVFSRYFEFSQTFTSVSITYGITGKNVFYFFYKITRRKLKRWNSLLYQSVNSPYCLWWRIMAWTFPCFPKLTFWKYYFYVLFNMLNCLLFWCQVSVEFLNISAISRAVCDNGTSPKLTKIATTTPLGGTRSLKLRCSEFFVVSGSINRTLLAPTAPPE